MPIIPQNYRLDDPFIPLSDVDKIDKDDYAPVSGFTGRARPGTWLQFAATGVQKPGGEVKFAAAPSWSDYDSTGVAGHPDAYRLGKITVLIGSHRGKTRYFKQTTNPPTAGALLSITTADATEEVVPINAAAGATVIETGDGVLRASSAQTEPAVALCLTPPASGYITYYKY